MFVLTSCVFINCQNFIFLDDERSALIRLYTQLTKRNALIRLYTQLTKRNALIRLYTQLTKLSSGLMNLCKFRYYLKLSSEMTACLLQYQTHTVS